MVNFRYQLIVPKVFRKNMFIESLENKLIVKPTYLSLCAADYRYYFGKRDPEKIMQKLPMSLIHEGIGIVVRGNDNFAKGQQVVLYPNVNKNHITGENYFEDSKFMSSSLDGFMQEFIIIDESQLIKFNDKENEQIYVMTELLSVAIHAVNSIKDINSKSKIAIWGDGSLAYLIHLYLIKKYPKIRLTIYGINDEKLAIFRVLCKVVNITRKKHIDQFDFGFEVVGGEAAENIINTMIYHIKPQGKILLLGVSENNVSINTRLLLEKGVCILGRSRSSKSDFIAGIDFIIDNLSDINKCISSIVDVFNIEDIIKAFKVGLTQDFKTIMKWNI